MDQFAHIIQHSQEVSTEDRQTDQSSTARAAKCQSVPPAPSAARPNVPQSAIQEERRAPQSAAMCPQVPPSATLTENNANEKTNPRPSFDRADLTHTQRAAARLLVAGGRTIEIARELKLNRHTIPRWKRLPEFAAELSRLQSLADRAFALKMMNPGTSAAAPKPVSRPPVSPPSVNQSPAKETFAQATIRLGQEGVFPFQDLQEFRRRMHEAGFDV